VADLIRFELQEMDNGSLVVRVHGELDAAGEHAFERALEPALVNGRAELVIDLSGVTFIDSTGIRCLIRANERANGCGMTIRFQGATGVVRRALEIVGLPDLLG
jgi:anti-anti-sigma factor